MDDCCEASIPKGISPQSTCCGRMSLPYRSGQAMCRKPYQESGPTGKALVQAEVTKVGIYSVVYSDRWGCAMSRYPTTAHTGARQVSSTAYSIVYNDHWGCAMSRYPTIAQAGAGLPSSTSCSVVYNGRWGHTSCKYPATSLSGEGRVSRIPRTIV